MALGMLDSAGVLSTDVLANPIVAFGLRAALGAYVAYMARGFYADPGEYFRRWLPRLALSAIVLRAIRGAALFCLWGGCFIVSTALATLLLDFRGLPLALLLVMVAAIATYLLLPKNAIAIGDDDAGGNMRRQG